MRVMMSLNNFFISQLHAGKVKKNYSSAFSFGLLLQFICFLETVILVSFLLNKVRWMPFLALKATVNLKFVTGILQNMLYRICGIFIICPQIFKIFVFDSSFISNPYLHSLFLLLKYSWLLVYCYIFF